MKKIPKEVEIEANAAAQYLRSGEKVVGVTVVIVTDRNRYIEAWRHSTERCVLVDGKAPLPPEPVV